jgi:hypothetical protein
MSLTSLSRPSNLPPESQTRSHSLPNPTHHPYTPPDVELIFFQHSTSTPNLSHVAHAIDAIARLSPNLCALQITCPTLNLEFAALISTRLSNLETLAIYRPRLRSAYNVEYEKVCPHSNHLLFSITRILTLD